MWWSVLARLCGIHTKDNPLPLAGVNLCEILNVRF